MMTTQNILALYLANFIGDEEKLTEKTLQYVKGGQIHPYHLVLGLWQSCDDVLVGKGFTLNLNEAGDALEKIATAKQENNTEPITLSSSTSHVIESAQRYATHFDSMVGPEFLLYAATLSTEVEPKKTLAEYRITPLGLRNQISITRHPKLTETDFKNDVGHDIVDFVGAVGSLNCSAKLTDTSHYSPHLHTGSWFLTFYTNQVNNMPDVPIGQAEITDGPDGIQMRTPVLHINTTYPEIGLEAFKVFSGLQKLGHTVKPNQPLTFIESSLEHICSQNYANRLLNEIKCHFADEGEK